MPARIIAPRTGDTVTIPLGGSVTISFFFDFAALTNVKGDINATDFGPHVPVSGVAATSTAVVCSKPVGTHLAVPVHIATSPTVHDTQNPKIVVMGPPPPPPRPVALRVAPAPPAAAPPPGSGPIQYILSDTFAPSVAYIVLAAHEMTADPADPILATDGVFVRNTGATAWAGMVAVPNKVGRVYYVRVIEYDANDAEVNKYTVGLP